MTDREKLIEVLDVIGSCNAKYCVDCEFGNDIEGCVRRQKEIIADHLIANGVTVQQWIPVTERLPTIYDADADNCLLAIHKASNKRYYHWRSVADNPFDFTHWMRTPQPPKGEWRE